MHTNYDHLILGAGMAAHAAASGLRAQGATGTIGVLGAEPDPPVARPPLSKDLWGPDTSEADVLLDTAGESGAALHLGSAVTAVDTGSRTVATADGSTYGYGSLLVATGGWPRQLEGLEPGDRVVYFRTIADHRALRALAEADPAPRVVVVGSGFIGTEIAAALAGTAASVVLVHPGALIGDHVFPEVIARDVEAAFAGAGVEVRGGSRVARGEAHADGVVLHLEDGSILEADVAVVGLGITPATEMLAGVVDLADDGGVVVDEHLRSSVADVYAAGDVASYPDPVLGRTRVEHEDNAVTMGAAAGRVMAGSEEVYEHTPFFYSDLFDDGYEAIGTLDTSLETLVDPTDDGYVVYYLDQDRVRGVLLWNVWDQVDAARDLLARGTRPADAEELRGTLG